eukprot:TRINITY_DN27839_c0_g1_i5.p1 TRINITY_DN27839_c0_g1~~TRINITY_DN27839_c0_g1_i5.p1  ORF type:complete len:103 (-),score=15.89 TRINITY_DN27839_c0_g1_i5:206-514(-)
MTKKNKTKRSLLVSSLAEPLPLPSLTLTFENGSPCVTYIFVCYRFVIILYCRKDLFCFSFLLFFVVVVVVVVVIVIIVVGVDVWSNHSFPLESKKKPNNINK